MKTLLAIICFVSLAIASSQAQTATTNAPVAFYQSFGDYFTSSNTNLPANSSVEVAMGAGYQGGVNTEADLNIRYKFGSLTNTSGWYVESDTCNAGIAGIIVSEEIGGGYYLIHNDIELSGGLRGGYRFDENNGVIGGNLRVLKMMTANYFSGAELAVEFSGNSQIARVPRLNLFTGFKF